MLILHLLFQNMLVYIRLLLVCESKKYLERYIYAHFTPPISK